MIKTLKRSTAVLLALLLCITTVPAGGIAEQLEAQESADAPAMLETQQTPIVEFRVHAKGADPWADDAGWQQYSDSDDTSASEETTPLDSLEARLSVAEGGIEYRLLNKEGLGPDQWSADGAIATQEEGAYGVEARLTGEVASTCEVLYRTRTAQGAWSEWAHAEESSKSELEPIVDIQFTLAALEESSTDSDSADAEPEEDVVDEDLEVENAEEGAEKEEAELLKTLSVEELNSGSEASKTSSTSSSSTTTTENNSSNSEEGLVAAATPSVEYKAHVQTLGWQDWTSDGTTMGTVCQGKRLEAVNIRLKNASGSIVYQAHVQTHGWMDEVKNGALSGTTGESKRIEAMKIRLTGKIAETHDVYYRLHVQTFGWQSWSKNGELAGTVGHAKRVEAMEIRLVQKGSPAPSDDYDPNPSTKNNANVRYQTHVQTYGWQPEVTNGEASGTTGQSKRLEAIRIRVDGESGGVTYRTHVQTYGWQDWKSDNDLSGTSGQSKRLEAIEIKLTGDIANSHDIWYRCHAQKFGWLGWTKNGASAGTSNGSLRLEAIEIQVLPKGSITPGSTDMPYVAITPRLNGVDIFGGQASIDIANTEGDFFIVKATEGVPNEYGPATRYNPTYKIIADQVLATNRLLGFYHYANGGDAIAEADAFYDAIEEYKGRAIACLDWEGTGNKLFNTGMDVSWCKTFLDRLQSRFGGTPFLYTSKNYCNAYSWYPVASKYPLWGAEYAGYNDVYGFQAYPWQSYNGWGAWGSYPTIFQYSGNGVLERNGGIKYFDLDLFYGSAADWMSYVG